MSSTLLDSILQQHSVDMTVYVPPPQVIFSACELGVFDLLLKSPEPVSAQHVAQELNTSVDGMERLLDALVGFEILDVELTNGTGGGGGGDDEHGEKWPRSCFNR